MNFGENANSAGDLKSIGIYDQDGDLVVLSDAIPNDQTFTVRLKSSLK